MILEDCNLVPIYMDFRAILCIRLQAMQGPDDQTELPARERGPKTLYQVDFHMMLGIVNSVILNQQQWLKLWEDLKNDRFA